MPEVASHRAKKVGSCIVVPFDYVFVERTLTEDCDGLRVTAFTRVDGPSLVAANRAAVVANRASVSVVQDVVSHYDIEE